MPSGCAVFRSDSVNREVNKLKDLISLLSRNCEEEIEIYRTEDSFGAVVVTEYGKLRVLSFDSHFEQSAMHLENPLELVHGYLRAMVLVLAFKQPRHVTLLGLGGGGLLRALHARCLETQIKVVELRKSVISVATEHFGLPVDDRVVIRNRNGFIHLNEARKHSSDIIFADMYQANAMEPFQATTRFLEQCWHLLTNDGWLAINFHKLPALNHPYMLKLCRLFPEVYCCGTDSGNFVVLCGKRILKQPLAEYRKEVIILEQRFDTCLSRYFDQIIRIGSDRSGRLAMENGSLPESGKVD